MTQLKKGYQCGFCFMVYKFERDCIEHIHSQHEKPFTKSYARWHVVKVVFDNEKDMYIEKGESE